jgi:hypothetical protein
MQGLNYTAEWSLKYVDILILEYGFHYDLKNVNKNLVNWISLLVAQMYYFIIHT